MRADGVLILAVSVRYKTPLEESTTISSLAKEIKSDPAVQNRLQICIWDNSLEKLNQVDLPFPALYHHSGQNLGLSGAYNRAIALARELDIPWLLLLDQDTTLPPSFLSDMLELASEKLLSTEIAAIAPTVLVGNFIASPRRMLFNRHVPYPEGECGLAGGEAAVINSGTVIRVSSLVDIGGYNENFWLDYSDWYVFHQLHLRRKKVWRAANIRLQHSMTVMDYDNLMSTGRYWNYIRAEGAFNDMYKGSLENLTQHLRLAVRAAKQYFAFKNTEFSRITRKYLWWRLCRSRVRRIREWKQTSGPPQKTSSGVPLSASPSSSAAAFPSTYRD